MRIFRLFIPSLYILMIASLIGCGITDPKFENYEDGDSSGDSLVDPSTECGQTALTAFTTNVGATLDSTCALAGCHASGAGAAAILFTAGENETNRTTLYGYTGFDREKLTNYLGGGSHGGGDRAADMPVTAVTAWLDAEETCVNGATGS